MVAVAAALSFVGAPAPADTGFDIHAEGAAVHLLGERSSQFGWGAALLVAPELKLGRTIGLEIPLGIVSVSEGVHPSPAYMGSSGGSAYFAMPGVRIRPFAGRIVGWGDGVWIAGGAGLTDTGGVLGPSVDVRAGADLHVGPVALGPFLGFMQIIDVQRSALRNDARLMAFGVHGRLSPLPPPAQPTRASEDDHDGVPDGVDTCKSMIHEDGQCSDEPPPPPIATTPVEEEDFFELDDRIYFQPNSAAISFAGIFQLHGVTALLKQHQEYARLRILGHADDYGEESYDMRLSEERASAVRAILIRLGVEEGRIEMRSFGKHRPRQLEHTLVANAENRRVEFQIVRRREVAPPPGATTKGENEGSQR